MCLNIILDKLIHLECLKVLFCTGNSGSSEDNKLGMSILLLPTTNFKPTSWKVDVWLLFFVLFHS